MGLIGLRGARGVPGRVGASGRVGRARLLCSVELCPGGRHLGWGERGSAYPLGARLQSTWSRRAWSSSAYGQLVATGAPRSTPPGSLRTASVPAVVVASCLHTCRRVVRTTHPIPPPSPPTSRISPLRWRRVFWHVVMGKSGTAACVSGGVAAAPRSLPLGARGRPQLHEHC